MYPFGSRPPKIAGLTGLWVVRGGVLSPVNLVTGRPATNYASGSLAEVGTFGGRRTPGRNLNGVTTNRPILGTCGELFDVPNKRCSVLVVARRNGSTNERGLWFSASGSSGGLAVLPASSIAGLQIWQPTARSGGPTADSANGVATSLSYSTAPQTYLFTADDVLLEAWQGLTRVTSATKASQDAWPSGTANWGMSGDGTWDSFVDTDSSVYLVATFNRRLSDAEAARYLANPWQLVLNTAWVPVASAGGGTVPSITAVYADSVTSSSVDLRVTLDYA